MKFPPITGLAVYAGYRPTTQEIQTARAVDVPVKVRVKQLSKWKYQAFFADSRPHSPLHTASGRPIRGDIAKLSQHDAEICLRRAQALNLCAREPK
jgi:hypothetical protein